MHFANVINWKTHSTRVKLNVNVIPGEKFTPINRRVFRCFLFYGKNDHENVNTSVSVACESKLGIFYCFRTRFDCENSPNVKNNIVINCWEQMAIFGFFSNEIRIPTGDLVQRARKTALELSPPKQNVI